MSAVASSAGGSGGGDSPGDRHHKRDSGVVEEEEEEEKKRGRKNRGGKKYKKQVLLKQAYELGTHTPKGSVSIPQVGDLQAGHPIVSVKQNPHTIFVLSEESVVLADRLANLRKAKSAGSVATTPSSCA